MSNFKQKAFRSKKYLEFVRLLTCSVCATDQNIVAHHLIGIGGMGGMGTKAPDNMTMPLCPECHAMVHRSHLMWPDQWEYIAKTQARFIDEIQRL